MRAYLSWSLLATYIAASIAIELHLMKLAGEHLSPSLIGAAHRWVLQAIHGVLIRKDVRFKWTITRFEAVFGTRFFSLRRVSAVAVATCVSILLSSLLFELALAPVNYIAWQSTVHYDRTMAIGALILFLTTFITELISVQKTHRLLLVARSRGGIFALFVVVADLALTVGLFLLLFPVGYAVCAVAMGWREAFPYYAAFNAGMAVHVTGRWSLFLWSYGHQLVDGIGAFLGLAEQAYNHRLAATLVRIPVTLTDDEMWRHMIMNGRYPAASYLYPYAHSFLASFVVVTWSITWAVGTMGAYAVRFGVRLLTRILRTKAGYEALEHAPIAFAVAIVLLAGGVVLSLFILVAA